MDAIVKVSMSNINNITLF